MSLDILTMGGGGGATASLIVTGLGTGDTVRATKDGKTIAGVQKTRTVTRYQSLIPHMTSDTTPEGVVSYRNTSGGTSYYAFDGDETTMYCTVYPYTAGSDYVQYEFAAEVEISKLRMRLYNDRAFTYTFLTSEDGTTWSTVCTMSRDTSLASGIIWREHELPTPVTAKYIRCRFDLWTSLTGNPAVLPELEAWGNVEVQELVYEIAPVKEYGIWTVIASNGTKTVTQDVLVDAAVEFEVAMSYVKWLYNEGDECEDVTGGWVGTEGGYSYPGSTTGASTGTKNSDNMYFPTDTTSGSPCLGTDVKINLTPYTTLHYVRMCTASELHQPWVAVLADGKVLDGSNRQNVSGNNSALNVKEHGTIDISDVTGEYYIAAACTSSAGGGNVYQIWLE